jgi:hypothetical protein
VDFLYLFDVAQFCLNTSLPILGCLINEVFLQRRPRLCDSCTLRECNIKSSLQSEVGLAINPIKAKSDFVWILIACQPLSWKLWDRHGKALQDDKRASTWCSLRPGARNGRKYILTGLRKGFWEERRQRPFPSVGFLHSLPFLRQRLALRYILYYAHILSLSDLLQS